MIRSIDVIPLRLPVAAPLTLSRGVAADPAAGAPHVLVKVTNGDGIVGWGEARPSHRWSPETEETSVLGCFCNIGGRCGEADQGRPCVGLSRVQGEAGITPATDLEMMQEVTRAAGGKPVWLDANQGWDFSTAVRLSRALAGLGVRVIEQPLPAGDITGYADLVRRSDSPIVLDESIGSPRDLIQWLRLGAINGLVIKLCRVGGLWWARQLAEMAAAADLLLLGSGLTEGRIGLMAAAQLFAGFGTALPADLNGPQFLKDDMVRGLLAFPDRTVPINRMPGIGVEPDPEKLERYRVRE